MVAWSFSCNDMTSTWVTARSKEYMYCMYIHNTAYLPSKNLQVSGWLPFLG